MINFFEDEMFVVVRDEIYYIIVDDVICRVRWEFYFSDRCFDKFDVGGRWFFGVCMSLSEYVLVCVSLVVKLYWWGFVLLIFVGFVYII